MLTEKSDAKAAEKAAPAPHHAPKPGSLDDLVAAALGQAGDTTALSHFGQVDRAAWPTWPRQSGFSLI